MLLFLTVAGVLTARELRAQQHEDNRGNCMQSVSEGASVAQPIALTNVSAISFGRVLTGAVAGPVTVSATGVATASLKSGGPAVFNSSAMLDPSPASFYVSGEPGYDYNILTPTTCTVSDGSSTMTVTFSAPVAETVGGHAPSGHLTGSTSRIALNGYDAWVIGGTLSVGASQPIGNYTGSFDEEVAYQ